MSNTNTMIFTLTAELKEVLNLFAREAGKNKTGSAYPEAVLASGNILSAANGAIMLRYQLGEDETGLMPTVFEKPVLIPIKGIRAIIDANIGTEITIAATRSAITIAKSKKKSGKIELSALDASTFPEFGKFDFAGIDKVQVFCENLIQAFIPIGQTTFHADKLIERHVHIVREIQALCNTALIEPIPTGIT